MFVACVPQSTHRIGHKFETVALTPHVPLIRKAHHKTLAYKQRYTGIQFLSNV